jgi:hypothetical protein
MKEWKEGGKATKEEGRKATKEEGRKGGREEGEGGTMEGRTASRTHPRVPQVGE